MTAGETGLRERRQAVALQLRGDATGHPGAPAASWRQRGRRAPSLYDNLNGTAPTLRQLEPLSPGLCSTEGSLGDSGSCNSFTCSSPEGDAMAPMAIGGEPAIPIGKQPVSSSSESGSLLRGSTGGRKKKNTVAWATPNSLHDTRIITPSTHPNRMGQFNARTAKASVLASFLNVTRFTGGVGDHAQVALMDKTGIVGWIDCSITVVNSDGTFDINVKPSPLAEKHSVSNLAAYAINALHLRYPQ